MLERLQKILSARGIASRRKAEEYITAGLVKVNGNVAKLGQKADPEKDRIEVDGKVLSDRAEMLYYVLNKPEGVETTNVIRKGDRGDNSDKSNRGMPNRTSVTSVTSVPSVTSVRDLLPQNLQGKIFPVGRLDKDSEGLLLFTNDGVLAYRLTHPGFQHDKEYDVTLARVISPSVCRKIEQGFLMDGRMTKPLTCTKVGPERIRIILTEGKNRQIRRMCQAVGFTVKKLKRIRIMTLSDDTLRSGTIRALKEEEKNALLKSVGLGSV